MRLRTDAKLAEGLWRVSFINHSKLKCWLVFVEDSREKTIAELNKKPRYKKGKNIKHVFRAMGIKHISDTENEKQLLRKILE
jgi:hypothetical protein